MKISQIIANSGLKPNIARKILCEILGLSFEKLFLKDEINESEFFEFSKVCNRYKNGEPLEYIFASCEFLGRKFKVNSKVLIPRIETEILVQKSLEVAKNMKNPVIFDVCTGSGIIAISLALALKNAKIIASDISENALEIAKENAKNLGAENIEFFKSNLLENLPPKADIIVSNPPYIANDYKLDAWVLAEPKIALFGGEKGDEILKEIIKQSATATQFLCCEMGYDQKKSLEIELEKFGFKSEFYKDLAGFDRGFVAQKI